MKPKGRAFPNVYMDGKEIYTLNAFPGRTHFSENIVRKDGKEYRHWDPTRSKLCATMMKGASQIGFREGDVVLYLGAGHGYTPSHVSDIVRKGMVFCLDSSPRVLQDLIPLCEERKNMAPILGDANKPETYEKSLPKVDVVFQDVAQKNQVEIFLKNVKKYLKDDGFALLALKARSIDVNRKPHEVFEEVRKELEQELIIADYRKLAPFEKDHALFLCKK